MKKLLILLMALLSLFMLTSCEQEEPIDLEWEKEISYSDGTYVGRNALLLYMVETEQMDTVTIDIMRLMEIEDSLKSIQTEREVIKQTITFD